MIQCFYMTYNNTIITLQIFTTVFPITLIYMYVNVCVSTIMLNCFYFIYIKAYYQISLRKQKLDL